MTTATVANMNLRLDYLNFILIIKLIIYICNFKKANGGNSEVYQNNSIY
jgi:hypothetical protein